MCGPILMCTMCSDISKQQLDREMGRTLLETDGSARLKTGNTMLRFHSVGTTPQERTRLKKFSTADCHHGRLVLNKEYGNQSMPTAESTRRNSDDTKTASNNPGTTGCESMSRNLLETASKNSSTNGWAQLVPTEAK